MITYVDTSRYTARGERQHLQRSKVRLAEHVDLKVRAPRQGLDELRRVADERLVLRTELLVYDRGEAYAKKLPSALRAY